MLKRSSSALSTAKITILALAGIFLSELATAGFLLEIDNVRPEQVLRLLHG